MSAAAAARAKGSGRIFVRAGKWYLRIRRDGIESTRSTHISLEEDPDGIEAQKMAEKETEVFRIKERSHRLAVVKSMCEDVNERLKDRLAGIHRDALLSSLDAMFMASARRPDCGEGQTVAYRRYIAALVETIGGEIRIADVDDATAERFMSQIAVGRSPNTFNKYLSGLALVWSVVSPSLGISGNPWERMPRKKLDTHVRRILTEAETDRLLRETKGETRKLIAIGLYTGLRLSDAATLRWRDIHNGAVFVTTQKTGAKVGVPLHPVLADVLGSPSGRDCAYVTPDFAEMEMSTVADRKYAIVKAVNEAFRKCGIRTSCDYSKKGMRARPDATFHSLRHTFASRCLAAGVPHHIVQALVGHTTAKMTDHYIHLTDNDFLLAFKGKMA